MMKRTPLALGITFLFVALAFQASALASTSETTETPEITIVDNFMDRVEQTAAESTSLSEFFEKLQPLCNDPMFIKYPVMRKIFDQLFSFIGSECFKDTTIGALFDRMLDRISGNARPDFLVISYGVYKRLNPFKDNSVVRVRPGLSMWRYSDASVLVKGRTLVIERKPFGIHQRVTGPQLGLMKGFIGLYVDHESKLTKDSYVFFLGHANRIHVFDLTPFAQ